MRPTPYEKRVIRAFNDLCDQNGGASPVEVTELLVQRGQLSPMDTTLDIASIMRELRSRGFL